MRIQTGGQPRRYAEKELMSADPIQQLAVTCSRIDIDLVTVIDVDGINYVAGSEGKPRLLTGYDMDGITPVATTQLFYRSVDFPTKVTSIINLEV